ncbi:hypothetical protein P154DRAFT_209565 [Amniculicola lignicola CBS 123094]|uniref:Uncharacterized protein n=1 Tax=Amniculicola lignicola CBS 123094 TaxID=1392246 RepID=A0A6A5WRB3_9PLEO|nr:hypothetical protein P154DRAFT_209565 [Amniculicola lignicola CBS 123094]
MHIQDLLDDNPTTNAEEKISDSSGSPPAYPTSIPNTATQKTGLPSRSKTALSPSSRKPSPLPYVPSENAYESAVNGMGGMEENQQVEVLAVSDRSIASDVNPSQGRNRMNGPNGEDEVVTPSNVNGNSQIAVAHPSIKQGWSVERTFPYEPATPLDRSRSNDAEPFEAREGSSTGDKSAATLFAFHNEGTPTHLHLDIPKANTTLTKPDSRPKTPRTPKEHPINIYWDRQIWRSMAHRSTSIRKIIEVLGLDTKDTALHGIPQFSKPCVNRLQDEVTAVAARLPKALEELIDVAADPRSLDHAIDDLCAEYGHDVWGMDANRSHLLDPTEGTAYSKDLLYENEEDRKMICLHLHQWICLKAFNTYRNTQRQKVARHAKEDIKENNSTPGTVFKKRHGSSPVVGNPRKLFKVLDDEAATSHHDRNDSDTTTAERSLFSLTSTLFSDTTQSMPSNRMLRRCTIADLLVRRLHKINNNDVDEHHLLNLIEQEWSEYSAEYQSMAKDLYPLLNTTLTAWIHERRTVLRLEAKLKDNSSSKTVPPGSSPAPTQTTVPEWFMELNKLRGEHVALMGMANSVRLNGQECTTEEVLGYVFERLTASNGSSVREMWVEGLRNLAEELNELANAGREITIGQSEH